MRRNRPAQFEIVDEDLFWEPDGDTPPQSTENTPPSPHAAELRTSGERALAETNELDRGDAFDTNVGGGSEPQPLLPGDDPPPLPFRYTRRPPAALPAARGGRCAGSRYRPGRVRDGHRACRAARSQTPSPSPRTTKKGGSRQASVIASPARRSRRPARARRQRRRRGEAPADRDRSPRRRRGRERGDRGGRQEGRRDPPASEPGPEYTAPERDAGRGGPRPRRRRRRWPATPAPAARPRPAELLVRVRARRLLAGSSRPPRRVRVRAMSGERDETEDRRAERERGLAAIGPHARGRSAGDPLRPRRDPLPRRTPSRPHRTAGGRAASTVPPPSVDIGVQAFAEALRAELPQLGCRQPRAAGARPRDVHRPTISTRTVG